MKPMYLSFLGLEVG